MIDGASNRALQRRQKRIENVGSRHDTIISLPSLNLLYSFNPMPEDRVTPPIARHSSSHCPTFFISVIPSSLTYPPRSRTLLNSLYLHDHQAGNRAKMDQVTGSSVGGLASSEGLEAQMSANERRYGPIYRTVTLTLLGG